MSFSSIPIKFTLIKTKLTIKFNTTLYDCFVFCQVKLCIMKFSCINNCGNYDSLAMVHIMFRCKSEAWRVSIMQKSTHTDACYCCYNFSQWNVTCITGLHLWKVTPGSIGTSSLKYFTIDFDHSSNERCASKLLVCLTSLDMTYISKIYPVMHHKFKNQTVTISKPILLFCMSQSTNCIALIWLVTVTIRHSLVILCTVISKQHIKEISDAVIFLDA